jgi:hypothetical protein
MANKFISFIIFILTILSVSTLIFIFLNNPLVWALIPLYALLMGLYMYNEWKHNQELFKKEYLKNTSIELTNMKKKITEIDTLIEMSKVRR